MRHGTDYGYRSGCYCRPCTDAHAASAKALRARRSVRLASGEADVPHGRWSTYTNWGCRCTPCATAARVRKAGGSPVAVVPDIVTGVSMRARPEWTPERLAERYGAGVALRALCTESGLSYGTVYKRLTEHGVSMRPRGGANRPPVLVKGSRAEG